MKTHTLKADKRTELGRKVKRLRKEGKIPSNVYGKDIKSVSIVVNEKEFDKVYKEAGETGVVEITLDKETKPTLIHNVQTNPVTGAILHVDFFQVDLKKKITANVPIELEGESPAEKQGLGTVVLYVDEIEVESLPADIPEKFVLNIENLTEVEQQLTASDIKVDKDKVEIKEGLDKTLVRVEPLRKEEEVVPVAEVPMEGVVEGETKEETTSEGTPQEEKPQE
jgi:large subunit ribosomal protein L25